MTIEVELPDGSIVEFPDGTPSNVMEGALKQYKASPRRSPQELQAAMNNGDAGAAQEFSDRMKASTGQEYQPQTGVDSSNSYGFGRDSNMMAAAGSTLGDTANGIMQYGTDNPISRQSNALLNIVGIQPPENPLKSWIDKRIAEKRQLDAPMLAADGGTSGAILGNVMQLATPGAVAKLGAMRAPALVNVSRALNPTTYRGNAILGGVFGAIQPRVEGESQAANVALGAGTGVLGRGMVDVARSPAIGYRYLRDALTAGGGEARVAEDLVNMGVRQSPNIRQAPLNQFQLTTAQATLDPVLSALTRARRGRPEFLMALTNKLDYNQKTANQIIDKTAGTADDLEKAISTRRAQTGPLYRASDKYEGVDSSGVLRSVQRGIKRLEGSDAQGNMEDIANRLTKQIPDNVRIADSKSALDNWINSGARRSSEDTSAITEARRIINMRNQTPDEALAAIKRLKPQSVTAKDALKEAINTLKTATKPEDRAFKLQNILTDVKDMIKGGATASGAQKKADVNLIPIKTRLQETLRRQIPEFTQAQDKYKALSGPVNQMQVLQSISNRSRESLGNVSLGNLNSAMKADKTLVKSQTGLKNKGLKDILTPQQDQNIKGVRDYLRMAAIAEKKGGGINSQTGQNVSLLKNIADKQAGEFLKKLPIFGNYLDAKSKLVYENALNKALIDPKGLLEVLKKLPPKQRDEATRLVMSLPKLSTSIENQQRVQYQSGER